MLSNLLIYKLYALNNKRLRNFIRSRLAHIEGGQVYSQTLRKIFRNYHDIDIGMYSYGGCFSLSNVPSGTTIGRYCSFAQNIKFLSGNHPLEHKSLHPFFYNPALGYVDNLLIKRSKLKIGNDVWIGENAIILPSVSKIENGSVIGAGSIVSKDVPPFAVVAGNPAKIVRYRFSQEIIDQILESPWWDKDIKELKGNELEFRSFLNPLK